ncbi:hypothetical protein [Providencia rettgeri]|uniref:hypothetical protein n=1 Tax=Providencia rettgeri TaxID=587 RepID=UPI002361A5B4|nr:hypothetical protein [Providencia rettgeri]
MTQQGEKAIEIIKAVRSFEYFTVKQVQNITGIPYSTANTIIGLMHRFRAVLVTGKIKGTVKYKISSDAVQVVKREFNEVIKPIYNKREKSNFDCGIVYVEKANVAGLGNSFLKRIDSLLSEVRV